MWVGIIGSATQSGVYASVGRPSVSLSVCLSQHVPTAGNPPLQVCCCGQIVRGSCKATTAAVGVSDLLHVGLYG